jgi:hypothetical protein
MRYGYNGAISTNRCTGVCQPNLGQLSDQSTFDQIGAVRILAGIEALAGASACEQYPLA